MAANQKAMVPLHVGLIASFLWFIHSFERRSLIANPRLSTFLILLIAGTVSYLGDGLISKWLPGAHGRFDGEASTSKGSRPALGLPKRPRRYFLLLLVACVALRLEAFIGVKHDYQCSSPGVEAFLPLAILSYELLSGRSSRRSQAELLDGSLNGSSPTTSPASKASGLLSAVGSALLCVGVCVSQGFGVRSSTFCSHVDPGSWVVSLQLAGLALDASIVVLFWRTVTWTRTTPLMVKTVGAVLLQTSAGIGLVLVSDLLLVGLRPSSADVLFLSVDTLYVFDVVLYGLVLSLLMVSSAAVSRKSKPSTLANALALLCGLLNVAHRLPLLGTWQQLSRSSVVGSLALMVVGFSLLLGSLRAAIPGLIRIVVVLLLLALLIATSVFALFRSQSFTRHPVQALLTDARIESDRWLVHATVSKTLKVAVQEYRERHGGRAPPKGFDVWYAFATERSSLVIDHFGQIRDDLLPFWGVKPFKIREGIARLEGEPDIAILVVKDGSVSFKGSSASYDDSERRETLDAIADMIRPFAQHLTSIEIAINLDDRPRVLTPWDAFRRHTKAAERSSFSLLPRSDSTPRAGLNFSETAQVGPALTMDGFRAMNTDACASNTLARSTWRWNKRDLCPTCIQGRSWGPFLRDWSRAADVCHQPDLLYMHGFYLTAPPRPPFRELLPVFSRAKTGGFNDILIPWPRRGDIDSSTEFGVNLNFQMQRDRLFWRGELAQPLPSHELLHGGHQERLAHLVNNASNSDLVPVCLATTADKARYRFERASAREMSKVLPFDVAMGKYANCDDKSAGRCATTAAAIQAEFGPAAEPASENALLLVPNRYALVTDSDAGPLRRDELMRALESRSVPFVATVFREWFTERLTPWAHFVPVDLRFHALHATLAYFTGLKGRGLVNGRDPDMDAHLDDGEWIAEQGRKWASRALRKTDAEIYFFRLLLEWGRLVSDQREDMDMNFSLT